MENTCETVDNHNFMGQKMKLCY